MQYHLVWCTKYRKQVLKNGIDAECKKMLYGLAEEYKFKILAMEVMPDHYSFTSGLQTAIFYIRHDKDYEGESGTSVVSFASGIKTGAVGRTFVESIVLCSHRK